MIDSTTISALEQVVLFTQARHGVLAGNIANIDTPGYQTKDLSVEDFEARLKEAIEGGGEETTTSISEVNESTESLLYHDGSNVSLEHQIAEISKNQSKHNLAISILRHQYALLEVAISERIV